MPSSDFPELKRLQRAPAILVPNEREINIKQGWDCSGVKQFGYNGGGAHLYHTVTTPPGHPFASEIWAGTCDVGQLTPGGFHDSITHGKVKRISECLLSTGTDVLEGPLGCVSHSLGFLELRRTKSN